ncbi:MAG: J domain-containing protein [Candidatus Sericytochromatia bacterium]|nr:J domain-containing protein [Candidatus Sericytochromatia bacterium]
MKDFYKILGVSRSATDEQIRKAYRRLARRFHPDLSPDDPAALERFKELAEAYETLGDAAKRRRYDASAAGWPFSRSQPSAQPGAPSAFSGIEDLLTGIFGQPLGPRPGRPRKGADLQAEANITLEEVNQGTTLTLSLTPPSGETRRLRVKVPMGIASNTRIRVAGEGDPGDFGGQPGDLYVRVNVKPHPVFRREGLDLHTDLPVSVFDAVLGARLMVPTLTEPVELSLEPGTQGDTVLRLRGKGLNAAQGAAHGDLFVHVVIRVPNPLSPRDRADWEALAARATDARSERPVSPV